MTRRGPGSVPLLLALLVTLVVAGCTTVPDDGPVRESEASTDEDAPGTRYVPPGPVADSSPTTIVAGFLEAMKGFPVTSEVAKEFLTPEAAEGWDPTRRTIVAEEVPVPELTGPQVATVGYTVFATLDPGNDFTPGGDRSSTLDLRVARVDGQWRITNPPDAMLVDRAFFDENFVPASVWFVGGAARTLVPEPVYVPVGDQLTTSLVSSLLQGPSATSGGQLTSALPAGAELDVAVPVRDSGVAEVRLEGDFDDVTDGERELLLAQLVVTLRQATGVTGVEVWANGSILSQTGDSSVRSVTETTVDDPASRTVPGQAFVLHNGRLEVLDDGETVQLAGRWGEDATGVSSFAVAPDLSELAAVTAGGTRLVTAPLVGQEGESPTTTVHTGSSIAAPAWDAGGTVWFTDRVDGRSTLWADGPGPAGPVPLGAFGGRRLLDVAISVDGARVAAVVADPADLDGPATSGARVAVAMVRRSPDGRAVRGLTAVRTVPLSGFGLRRPTSVGWRSPTDVTVLARRDLTSPQPYVVAIDGSRASTETTPTDPLLPTPLATTLTGPGDLGPPVYVADSTGAVWYRDDDQRWRRVPGRSFRQPTFPG